jgi:hypothetical protein
VSSFGRSGLIQGRAVRSALKWAIPLIFVGIGLMNSIAGVSCSGKI